MRRLAVPIKNGMHADKQDGQQGWRCFWRHGLVGALQYWAAGSRENIVRMISLLAVESGVSNEVLAKLLSPDRKMLEAQIAIARNVKAALIGPKPGCGTCCEKQRQVYGVVIAAAFGGPAEECDRTGIIRKIGIFLQVPGISKVHQDPRRDGSMPPERPRE